MKNETNKSQCCRWKVFSSALLAVAFLLILSASVAVHAAIPKGGSITIGTSKLIDADVLYEIKPDAPGFYKFTSVSSEDYNEVYLYTREPDDEWDYNDSFYTSSEKFLETGKTYYIRSDYKTMITVAAVVLPQLEIGKTNQAVKEDEYYVVKSPKNSDYVFTISSLNNRYIYAYIYDENLDYVRYGDSDKGSTATFECVLKANKTYYLVPGYDASVSIQIGEIGSSRDALETQLASAVAARKAAAAKAAAPPKVTLKSVKPAKKSLLVKWNKVKGISGYELQYGLNKKFTKGQKIVKVKGSKISKKVKKLSSKKKYYVRIRAYKTIKGGIIYGRWSKIKGKKVK